MMGENLRRDLIRLAHEDSSVRGKLVPLLRGAARAPTYQDYYNFKRQQGKPPMSREEWEQKVLQKKEKRLKDKGKKKCGSLKAETAFRDGDED